MGKNQNFIRLPYTDFTMLLVYMLHLYIYTKLNLILGYIKYVILS